MHNSNTLEEFRQIDKLAIYIRAHQQLLDNMRSGAIANEPERFCCFLLFSFADLKKYHFFYWFAFVTVALEHPVLLKKSHGFLDRFDDRQVSLSAV